MYLLSRAWGFKIGSFPFDFGSCVWDLERDAPVLVGFEDLVVLG